MPPDPLSTSSSSQTPRSTSREEHVTSTGWRVVGKAVSLITEAANTGILPSGRDEDVLYAAKFQMRPRIGGASAVPGALAALGAAIARDWQDAPPLTRDRPLTRAPGRFQGLRWDIIDEGGAWTGELVWRHPHPVVAGAPCTTHVVLIEQQGHTTFTVRVTADGGIASVRGTVGAGQARPGFLMEMNRALRLMFAGGDCEPRPLTDAQIEDFVRVVVLSESREHPIAVLAPLEEGGYAVPLAELAEELLGLAHLFVIDRHPTTFRLTDTLGDKRLSCYWGALRVYMPGFSCADRPEEHPLLVRERLLDPVMRADLTGKLGRFARLHVQMPPGVAERRRAVEAPAPPEPPASSPLPTNVSGVTPASVPPMHAEAPAAPIATAPPDLSPLIASMSPPLLGLGTQLGELAATIAHLVEANTALADEIARLRTTTAVRAANTTSLERRIGSIEQLLQRHLSPSEPENPESVAAADEEAEKLQDDDIEPLSLVDVLRQAATAHSDALLVLDSAERSAADSPYTDVDRLAVILDAMAGVARRRQEGALGTSLRVAFRELGIDYRGGVSPSTSEKHRQQYIVRGSDGRVFDCHEHIVLGTSYDPRHCLRVYFTSRAPVEPRLVIGHVGRHFDVVSTT